MHFFKNPYDTSVWTWTVHEIDRVVNTRWKNAIILGLKCSPTAPDRCYILSLSLNSKFKFRWLKLGHKQNVFSALSYAPGPPLLAVVFTTGVNWIQASLPSCGDGVLLIGPSADFCQTLRKGDRDPQGVWLEKIRSSAGTATAPLSPDTKTQRRNQLLTPPLHLNKKRVNHFDGPREKSSVNFTL